MLTSKTAKTLIKGTETPVSATFPVRWDSWISDVIGPFALVQL